ncbi:hypothetical protein B0H17DRAFT_1134435 [Mycena rosella]|uniref:F-box domain-containing protein n=1 Tax=Mycena rosella TaxID=1033263 RepID=A0AAD7DG11_MYCRO|nr:hypothetical protein B0H17DRAFT_1134435 [Mycena rosella]
MQLLCPEIQLMISQNLEADDLASLSLVSHMLKAISTEILFTVVRIEPADMDAFRRAFNNRFKPEHIQYLSIWDPDETLCKESATANEEFLSGLQTILESVTRIKCLNLEIEAVSTKCPAQFGPQYSEIILSSRFSRLAEFNYIIQHASHSGDSIHLPIFLNAHPTLKKIYLLSPPPPHHDVFAVPSGTILTLPRLEFLEAPVGFFSCDLRGSPLLFKIKVNFPEDHSTFDTISKLLEQMHKKPDTGFPHVQELILRRTHGYTNLDLLFYACVNFNDIKTLDIQGQYWGFKKLETFKYNPLYFHFNGSTVETHAQVASIWKFYCPSLKKIHINSWKWACENGHPVAVWIVETIAYSKLTNYVLWL